MGKKYQMTYKNYADNCWKGGYQTNWLIPFLIALLFIRMNMGFIGKTLEQALTRADEIIEQTYTTKH